MSEPKFTNDQVIAALYNTEGLQARAARELGCSLRTLHNYLEREPEIRDAYDELRELRLDDCESTIIQMADGRIEQPDKTRLAAAQCTLTTAWAKRGYSTGRSLQLSGQDQDGNAAPLNIEVTLVRPGKRES